MIANTGAENLKQQVRDFWNDAPCGSATISEDAAPFTRAYYEQIEAYRY